VRLNLPYQLEASEFLALGVPMPQQRFNEVDVLPVA